LSLSVVGPTVRRTLVAIAFLGGVLAVMAAVGAGAVGEPAPGDPTWWLIGIVIVGYWVAFARWARRGGAGR